VKHIAIIDDDPELLAELRDVLDATGYSTSAYADPVIGFSEIRVKQPDLILLDIKMEGLTGIQLAALIRLNYDTQKIPIIFLSANYHEMEVADVMKTCDIQQYLEKPINPEKLLKTVEMVLASQPR
jgi:DNA-binding response OmpR family regulator